MFGKVRVHTALKVVFDGGGAPVVAAQNGNVASLEDTGTGITTINLNQGLDTTQGTTTNGGGKGWFSIVPLAGALAGSDAPSFSVRTITDEQKVVYSVQEAAMGGASVLANVPFDLILFEIGDP